MTEAGERTYNKYLHAVRKQHVPSSKPGDIIFGSFTFDMANKALIQGMGALTTLSGLFVLMGKNTPAAINIVLMSLLMMISKDNIKIKSTVPVITREKNIRMENFCRDVSLIGAALILLGGMAGDDFSIYEEEKTAKVEEKDD